MRKYIKVISNYISKVNHYNKDQEEKVEYALRTIIFETLKIMGTIIIFSLIGYPDYALVATEVMITTKPFIGGYHEVNQVKCFISMILIIGSIIYLSINIDISFIAKLILNTVSLYCIWNQAPVVNPTMLITRTELLIRNRKIGIILSIIFIVISFIFYKTSIISNTIVWTVVFQALLMFNKRKGFS